MEWLIDKNVLRAFVINVVWERIFLYFDIKTEYVDQQYSCDELEFYAVNGLNAAKVHFKKEQIEKDVYRLKTNVTNNGENRCIPTGTYRIIVLSGNKALAECEAGTSIIPHMSTYSRNFLYSKKEKAYTVNFWVKEADHNFPFRFNTLISSRTNPSFPSIPKYHFFTWHPAKNFRKCYLEHRTLMRRFYKVWHKRVSKKSKKTVLFMTEQSDVIKSNLKAVSERMIERGLDQEFTILYSARSAERSQSKESWFHLIKKLAESDYIFLDDHAPVLDWFKLSKDTTVIQLWHAGAGFKSSGYSRWGHEGCPSPLSCHRQYSYGIAGSRLIAPFFSEVWGINDERVLPTGMPRMDEYLDPAHRAEKERELYEQFPVCAGKKVLLFAPTYRGTNKRNAYYPYELIDFDRLYQECGEEYIVLFKMHPWVNNILEIPERYADKFVDVKDYPNINDLFYITDLLITDYSSNIFEYSLMGKPMLFFAFDKIQYSFSRGFHRDYEESAPGKVCYTFDGLMDAFANKDFEEEKVGQYVRHHFDHIDSNASDRVIDWFLLDEMPEELKSAIEKQEEDMRHMNSLVFKPDAEAARMPDIEDNKVEEKELELGQE